MVIPGSHKGPLLSHHKNGVFAGAIDPDDPDFHFDQAVTLTGKAGSMTVHHARTLHGSAPNKSDRPRCILFYEAAAADAWPLLGAGVLHPPAAAARALGGPADRMICGEPSRAPHREMPGAPALAAGPGCVLDLQDALRHGLNGRAAPAHPPGAPPPTRDLRPCSFVDDTVTRRRRAFGGEPGEVGLPGARPVR
jgi:hypothetical protein